MPSSDGSSLPGRRSPPATRRRPPRPSHRTAVSVGGRYVFEVDSELVARSRRVGLVVLGKTNTAEFGLLATTEPGLLGPT